MPSLESTQLAPAVIDNIEAGLFIVDSDFRIVMWNAYLAKHSGIAEEALLGKHLFEAFPELPQKWLEKKLKGVLLLKNFSFTSWEQRPWLFQFDHNRPITGGIDCMRQNCVFTPLKDPETGLVSFVSVTIFDVTDTAIYQQQLTEALAKLEESNITDGLTGIYNRRYLQQRYHSEFGRASRHGSNLTTIIFDLDHFKRVNDTYGHLAGDEVLKTVAKRVKSLVRALDVVGRYGGEEFALILPDTDLEGGLTLAERIRETIAADPVPFGDIEIPVSASLGVSQFSPEMTNYELMVQAADQALYEAKHNGRNQVVAAK
ncbi:sensor domain-containing diguanylate cyclase [Leeia sp. TBRC 13508]|uniref:diguanylate cyclase n=1 Tax=Leeia speluncae TaxID=2884804 RepID=A0ABS8D6G5_9NEIS|nr:diguanylate cyclase [Leeia speluncae]MCB6183566.1 sensor domain-containing diguanylate cyclase [Leeia speluncae]